MAPGFAAKPFNPLFTIKSDPALRLSMRRKPARASPCATWENEMMVADTNKLEQAARVSMSGFQDAEPQPAPRSSRLSLRIGAVALLAAVALTAAWQLF
ncbi:hypothetical protein EOA23_14225 [Mesorhizobium sp. M2A.F.Ca.ET.042.01.1.1]|uniref:hypothetical protein n=1 Tax=Mesorhizobium sp. M2A.F.Ca.ET.042.01.1.1 TaxID=2496745 RepID=UPI000FCC6F69|nr:hypothetical protein [Mesorhizobium sp. M2A.F.Ca.ET.042.01.1.1]RUX29070.1 hypothetical protein EOA23_14225 [Mesorhizobium sp. M2A.F.Ca.ET.042.01.1.1]